MSSTNTTLPGRVPLIAHRTFATLLGLVGLVLTVLGGILVYLKGSPYYVAAGIVCLLISLKLFRRSGSAALWYALLLAGTLVWSIFEARLDFLALLPRVAMWFCLGLWFLTPWHRTVVATEQAPYGLGRRCVMVAAGACLVVLATAAFQGYTRIGTGTVKPISSAPSIEDWRHYGNTAHGTRFAQIDQINQDNVGGLKELWRYRTGVSDDFKMTPLQVGGLLYLCGARNVLIAVEDHSGQEVWRFDPEVVPPAEHQYAKTCRGISYVETATDVGGQCQARIVTGTVDARLLSVDAKTGQPCSDFGDGGFVNLRTGMGNHIPDQYYVTSPPLIADDVIVVGGLVLDSQDLGLPSGVVRAYDAQSGAFAWAWDVGRPDTRGEPEAGQIYTPGTPNVWSVMSYDPDLDLIYAPTGNASPDYWGGERRSFDDEWSSALVALDAQTGKARWRFQTVHHDVWDYDLPAQPVLVNLTVEGKPVPSVAVPTKTGEIFLLDRRDGSPVFPVEEVPVPQDPALGDYLSATQPLSPLPNFRPYRFEKDMWGLTPVDQLVCRIEYKMLRYEGLFTPPTTGGSFLYPGNFGGFNWGSVSVDADHGLLIAAPMMLGNRTMLVTPEQVAEAGPRASLLLGPNHPAVRMDPESPIPSAREPDPTDPYDHVRIRYYGLTLPFMARIGTQVPCFEPPWSRIAAIDLNTGELMWSRPVGSMKDSGPFGMRSGLPFQVGTPVRAGTLTTRGGLTFISSTMDRTARAFDVRTGEVLWSQTLPGNGQSTPMSFVSPTTRKQYVIVTVPNPSWRYPRDPATGTYTDSRSIQDGQGGYVIAYGLP